MAGILLEPCLPEQHYLSYSALTGSLPHLLVHLPTPSLLTTKVLKIQSSSKVGEGVAKLARLPGPRKCPHPQRHHAQGPLKPGNASHLILLGKPEGRACIAHFVISSSPLTTAAAFQFIDGLRSKLNVDSAFSVNCFKFSVLLNHAQAHRSHRNWFFQLADCSTHLYLEYYENQLPELASAAGI